MGQLYDAVLLPDGYVPSLDVSTGVKGMSRIAAEFTNVLRPGAEIHARQVMPGNLILVNRDLAVTYKFPTGHERHPELRHDWVDRGDGVLYGTLKPDPPLPVVPGDPQTSE